jgi:hypothetical protein
MGKSAGGNVLANAGAESFSTDAQPLTAVLPCKKGKTLLKAHLYRRDTDVAIQGETIETSGKAKLSGATAGATGLKDFGTVDPGDYQFDVRLSQALQPKYLPFQKRGASVPVQVDFHVTLKLDPRAQLRVVLFDAKGEPISGARWTLSSPVTARGTTPASGLIQVDVPWDADAATLAVVLPNPRHRAPAQPKAKKPNKNNPEYPIVFDPVRFLPAEKDSKLPELNVTWTLDLDFLKNADTQDGWKARLHNMGFPTDDVTKTQRSVKAYQRLKNKDYNGTGALSDISGSVKTLHDTV